MSSPNSFAASNSTPENNSPILPNSFGHLMSQGSYLSAVVNSSQFPVHGNYNTMIPLPPPASWAETIQPSSRALVPYQSQNNAMAGINRVTPYTFPSRFGLEAPQAPMANDSAAALQLRRPHNVMAAQQVFRAHNVVPAVAYNFASPFASQSRGMVTAPSVNLASAPPPTAPRQSALVTGTARNNVNWQVPSSSTLLPSSSIQQVHGSSGNHRVDTDPFVCPDCFARFKTGQALGGHRSWHSKEKRKLEGADYSGNKKFKNNSS